MKRVWDIDMDTWTKMDSFPPTFPTGGKRDGGDVIRTKVGRDMGTGQRLTVHFMSMVRVLAGWPLDPETIKIIAAIYVILTCHRSIVILANNTCALEGATGLQTPLLCWMSWWLRTTRSDTWTEELKMRFPHSISTWNCLTLPEHKPKPRGRSGKPKWT